MIAQPHTQLMITIMTLDLYIYSNAIALCPHTSAESLEGYQRYLPGRGSSMIVQIVLSRAGASSVHQELTGFPRCDAASMSRPHRFALGLIVTEA